MKPGLDWWTVGFAFFRGLQLEEGIQGDKWAFAFAAVNCLIILGDVIFSISRQRGKDAT